MICKLVSMPLNWATFDRISLECLQEHTFQVCELHLDYT